MIDTANILRDQEISILFLNPKSEMNEVPTHEKGIKLQVVEGEH